MQDDGRQNISWRLVLEFRMARAVKEPELDQYATTWCGREGPLAIAVQTHPNQEWDLWGHFQDQEPRSWHESPWVLQTCPWTQFPGNRLILSWNVEKGSYYLTQPVRRHWAMIENSAGKMRPKQTTAPKFVCAVTFISFVFVHVCVCVSLIYSAIVYVSAALWAKEGCNLHFCAHVQEQQQINICA